ncbi:MAG: hypothetical protein AB1755_02810 [Candidatus Omnitrophota bacterium]
MIDINLLPEKLKKKNINAEFNKDFYYNVIIALVIILAFIHLLIGSTFIFKKIKFRNLKSIVPKIEQDLKEISDLKNRVKLLQADTSKILDITKDRMEVAFALNRLSMDLSNGIWFRHLKLDETEFELEGSVVSLKEDEMSLLNKFLTSLKNEKNIKVSDKLELADAKKRNFQGIDIIDFILRVKIK